MRYLLVGSLTLLCVVFAVSALGKVRGAGAQRDFAAVLRLLRLLPDQLVPPVAAAITVAEAGTALGLLLADGATVGMLPGVPDPVIGPGAIDAVAVGALGTAGLVLSALTAGIALALRRGMGGRCACFGSAQRPLGRRHLVRNALFLLCVATGLVVTGTVGAVRDGPVEPAGALIATGAGVLGAMLLIKFDEIVELFAPVRFAGRTDSTNSAAATGSAVGVAGVAGVAGTGSGTGR